MEEIITNLAKHVNSEQQVTLLEDLIICLTFLPSTVVTESINTIYANHNWFSARHHSIAQWLQQRIAISTQTNENNDTSTDTTIGWEGGSGRLLASSFGLQVPVVIVGFILKNIS